MQLTELLERLRGFGDAPALIGGGTELSFARLLSRIDDTRAALRRAGVAAGDCVAFAGDYSPAACALLLAIGAENAIAVPLSGRAYSDPGERLAVAEVRWIVHDRDGALAIERREVARANPVLETLRAAGRPGLVIFTSASTGTSKAALHDVTHLLERYRRQRHAVRMLALLVFDHIGGINTVLYSLASGAAVVVPDALTAEAICRAIEHHRVELLPATPTVLRMLLIDGAHERHDLSSLRMISYGTEVMPEPILARVRAAFPTVTLHQMYGLTELGVMGSRSDGATSRWVRVESAGVETRVVDGTLRVRSRFAMLGYLNAPSPFDRDGWMDTHDRVEVRGDELLILGRDSDLINVGGEKVYPAEVEAVLLEMPNVVDATVYASPSPVTGSVVAARLVLAAPEELPVLRRRVREFCAPRLARYKLPLKLEIAAGPEVGDRYKKRRPR